MQNEIPSAPTSELTEREREILNLLATGCSNKEIAQRLVISSNTVKVHLRNIFAKIGVASRTEAALYAIHNGLSFVEPVQESTTTTPIPIGIKTRPYFLWIIVLASILLIATITFVITKQLNPISSAIEATPTTPQRWQVLADLPTARSGLAIAVYENKIYAIGGKTADAVTGMMEQYDVETDKWGTLTPKPEPVTDINAAVVGGKIFIPGGRLPSGAVTNIVESYDPHLRQWKKHAPLPVALSGYALVAFEGKLFIFGGWDGQKSLASTYEYDADQDKWITLTPMPTARSYAGAAVAAGKIYVIGGKAGEKALAINEEYIPENDKVGENPWTKVAPIPEARFSMGIASIADIIHVVGGDGQAGTFHAFEYFPQKNEWQIFEFPVTGHWNGLGVGVVETDLHTFGGLQGSTSTPTGQHLVYQAIYSLFIPVIR